MYVAGWNMPGYLPEMEPAEFDDFDSAKRFLIDEMKRTEEQFGESDDEDAAEEVCHDAEAVNLWSTPDSITSYGANLAWWISEAEPAPIGFGTNDAGESTLLGMPIR